MKKEFLTLLLAAWGTALFGQVDSLSIMSDRVETSTTPKKVKVVIDNQLTMVVGLVANYAPIITEYNFIKNITFVSGGVTYKTIGPFTYIISLTTADEISLTIPGSEFGIQVIHFPLTTPGEYTILKEDCRGVAAFITISYPDE